MIDFLMVALFQAAVGEPAPPVEQPAPEAGAPTTEEQPREPQTRCRQRAVVGTRIATERRCSGGELNRRQTSDMEAAQRSSTQAARPPNGSPR